MRFVWVMAASSSSRVADSVGTGSVTLTRVPLPPATGTFDVDRAAHAFDDPLADGETQSGSRHCRHRRRAHERRLEDPGNSAERNAAARYRSPTCNRALAGGNHDVTARAGGRT